MARVVSVGMQKGGVGKTTVSVNLAAAAAGALGYRVVLVDFDYQRNATMALLNEEDPEGPTIEHVLQEGVQMMDAMRPTPFCDRLYVVPGSRTLSVWEKRISEEHWDRLVKASRRSIRDTLPPAADLVIFDTPPSLGLWLQVALAATDSLIAVVQPERFSVAGVRELAETVARVRQHVNRRLNIDGLVINHVRSRTIEHSGFVDAYRAQFDVAVLEPPIPNRIIVPESQRAALPLEFYTDSSADEMREIFRGLARQVVERAGVSGNGTRPGRQSAEQQGRGEDS